MRDLRTLVGALCIVASMVLGAVAGFVYARPVGDGTTTSTDAGTRTGEPTFMRLIDENLGMPLGPTGEAVGGPSSLASLGVKTGAESGQFSPGTEFPSPSGTTLRHLTKEEVLYNAQQADLVVKSKDGTISTRVEQPGEGTRSHYGSGVIDAGGPYGGPDAFEGSTAITFTVTVNDPTILFVRWDFDDDGLFDYPDQTGADTLGRWTTQTTVTRPFDDNYFGDVTVEGWDGVSTFIQIKTGINLDERDDITWGIGMCCSTYYNLGFEFRAKTDMEVTQIGHYHYVYQMWDVAIFDEVGNMLGRCSPSHDFFSWNWCTLPTTVTLTRGSFYFVWERIDGSSVGLDPPPDTDHAILMDMWGAFCYDPAVDLCFGDPSGGSFWFDWGDYVFPMLDFRWREVAVLPDAASASAHLEVNNVAPTVFGATTSPVPGLEGNTPVEHVASFSDPGLGDDWEYRWKFSDGTVSAWRKVDKLSGGARVLFLHSYTGDINALKDAVAAECGVFCVRVDDLDIGPLGVNRGPTLEEVTAYDVIVVGTNWGWFGGTPAFQEAGDRLADFMDTAGSTGGGVVMMQAAFDNSFGDVWGVGGRWQDDMYSPVARSGFWFGSGSLGSIYVPGHPILDGVSTFTSFGLNLDQFDVQAGELVADFSDGRIAIATNENPMVPNGARAVALPWFPLAGWNSGDWARIIANSIRWASRQSDPVVKTMPFQLDPVLRIYPDDDPTSVTPFDTFPVTVEVRDDDDGKAKVTSTQPVSSQDFESPSACNFSGSLPPGWSASPPWGWQCGFWPALGSRGPGALWWYNIFSNSDLVTESYDLSAFQGARIEFYLFWAGGTTIFGGGDDFYIDASVDGGATFPIRFAEFHTNNPQGFKGTIAFENFEVAGASDVRFRFRFFDGFGLGRVFFDNVKVTGLSGEIINGLGSTDGLVTIANVPPTLTGGFDEAFRVEAQGLLFKGFEFSDPALFAPTESFAYAIDFGDGSPVVWRNVGSFSPPKFKVLLVNTYCFNGNSCGVFMQFRDRLLALDVVGSVDGYNYFEYPPTAPSLGLLLQYDVIIVATNWGWIGLPLWDIARRQLGDRLANYIDAGRGGVLTTMALFDTDVFGFYDDYQLLGRYVDDGYGPFKAASDREGGTVRLGTIHDDDHDSFWGVRSGEVQVSNYRGGNYEVTVGGQRMAAGRNGIRIADWEDGGGAYGAKELVNGMKTAHIGGFSYFLTGADAEMLLRGAIGWAAGGIAIPRIKSFTHNYGDNGLYTVDFMLIDDDMGFVWDPVTRQPVQVLTGDGTGIAHKFSTVSVDNVDPTIVPGSIEAFIAAQVCVRVSGTGGNSVTAQVWADGVLSATVTVTRQGGSPNPTDEKCGLLKVDVLAPHSYAATLTYSAPNGGSNPTWLIFLPWRDPISPGHGTSTYQVDFSAPGSVSLPLPTLKQDLVEGGQGAKIDFVAQAFDPGTDDLAFLWSWGTEGGIPYLLPDPTAVYTIHVHHNNGAVRTDGVLDSSDLLGFSEPYFDRDANDERSALGSMGLVVRDTAVHAFGGGQLVYYVFLMVLDDDNNRGYASPFLHDGIDIEYILVDLR